MHPAVGCNGWFGLRTLKVPNAPVPVTRYGARLAAACLRMIAMTLVLFSFVPS
jgi:hypothetical protein